MAAISSLKTALHGLRRNPVLFLGGLILGLVTLPQLTTQLAQIPLIPFGLQVVTFFVMPFFAAGLYAMADEATGNRGQTSLSTLTDAGREKYVPFLLAKIVSIGIMIPFGIAFAILAVVGVFAIGLSAATTGGGLAMGAGVLGLLGAGALLLLAYIIVLFLIQFFPVAVVVNDADAIESFKQSYRLARSNIVPTLGYSVIVLVANLIVMAPISGTIFFRSMQNAQQMQQAGSTAAPATMQGGAGFSIPEIAALSAILIAVQMFITPFLFTYAVAFFEAHQPGASGPDIDGDSVIPEFE
ncbi:hypothetical protein C453_07838 [Haloferax elongans ATCC BAA-1513]|uniref:DUF7847 domain-containing protein n=1 Tax=Haloferax elongans ATCC BAA-1513 TaxID=1230453 RepID=M0HRG3_HALEO|nr:hypothetical protein [Haloferax elongans]ELZ85709.1 hypothetical protein C453_07838 [Haloferax elongans ATCC BAA-1513]